MPTRFPTANQQDPPNPGQAGLSPVVDPLLPAGAILCQPCLQYETKRVSQMARTGRSGGAIAVFVVQWLLAWLVVLLLWQRWVWLGLGRARCWLFHASSVFYLMSLKPGPNH